MINQKSISAVDSSVFENNWVKPRYKDYCFSNITPTIINLFTGNFSNGLPNDTLGPLLKSYQKVVLLFLDTFGWQFFEQFKNKFSFLKHFLKEGVVSKLTSQFPSTTACEATTFYTGVPVGEHGVYEWFYYEPEADAVIAPLLFSFAGTKTREELRNINLDPHKILPKKNLFQTLSKNKITSYYFFPANYLPSSYNEIVTEGSVNVPYLTLSEALTNMFFLINNNNQKKEFYCLYFDKIDSLSHRYGPYSAVVKAEFETLFNSLEKIFYQNLKKKQKTLLIVTADHGQVLVSPETGYYLNRHLPDITQSLKTNSQGQPLVPAGSSRDFFLYIKENDLPKIQTLLKEKLPVGTKVYLTADLIKQGLFGPIISSKFKARLGNLVILPGKGQTVWWYEKDKFEIKYLGLHGGLTKEEMEIPFLIIKP